jgi:hypothetical protein
MMAVNRSRHGFVRLSVKEILKDAKRARFLQGEPSAFHVHRRYHGAQNELTHHCEKALGKLQKEV